MFNHITNQPATNTGYYAPKTGANKALAANAEKTINKNNGINNVVATERISPQQAADRILSHVTNGIEALRQSGASEQAINERLEQAKAGIEKGYAEAKEILEAMGLMTGELADSIKQGRELVDAGIAALENKQKPESAENISAMQAEQYSGSASMQLELRTQEGDVVNISFSQIQEYANSQYAAKHEGTSAYAAQMSAYSETNWQFSVDGHLNEQELDALNKVVKDVQKLGAAFFSGDFASALEQASQLGVGSKQLASLSLNLKQTQQYTAVSGYQTDKKAALPEPLHDFAGRLAGFAEQMQDTFNDAKPLAEPNKLIKELTEKMWQQEPETPALLNLIDDFTEQFKTLLS